MVKVKIKVKAKNPEKEPDVKKEKQNMFLNNIRKGERYNILAILTGKRKDAIKVYFNRNKIDVSDESKFVQYLRKNYIFNK